MIDRRGFVKGSTLGLAAIGLSPVVLWSVPSAGSAGDLTAAAFSAQQGSWFELRDGDAHHVRLIAVDEVPADPKLEQFHLVFRGPANDTVPEGAYAATSEAGHAYELFVRPSGSDADGNLYLASVSVFRPTSPASCAGAA
jgi:hypothetical protein